MQEEKQMERRKKIAVELSELVVYCRPVPFNEDSMDHTALSSSLVLSPSLCAFIKIVCFAAASRDRDGEGVLPGHVFLPRNKGREVCNSWQGETLPAVQPPSAFQSLSPRTEAGLIQLRPTSHVALRLPAGRTQFPDPRSVCVCAHKGFYPHRRLADLPGTIFSFVSDTNTYNWGKEGKGKVIYKRYTNWWLVFLRNQG